MTELFSASTKRPALRGLVLMALAGLSAPAVAAPGEGAAGGPAVTAGAASAASAVVAGATVGTAQIAQEGQFKSLFNSWKQMDGGAALSGTVAIPSVQPVTNVRFSSFFGVRSDPFQGTARMHAGVDIPGPVGTPVYATADGTVDRAERAGGYGNMVELDHGKGIQTRYGHLSSILVHAGDHIHRGQLIALMGSTGRSTGPHLHYEVRIDGKAVNPMPFLTTSDYLLAAHATDVNLIPVATGPAPQD